MHDGNGMKKEEIKREPRRLAVWDLHSQHLRGKRYVGAMHTDGTINYFETPCTENDDSIIRPADPSVFRVHDEHHQLFIDHYYDGEDFTSAEFEDSADSDDSSLERRTFS